MDANFQRLLFTAGVHSGIHSRQGAKHTNSEDAGEAGSLLGVGSFLLKLLK